MNTTNFEQYTEQFFNSFNQMFSDIPNNMSDDNKTKEMYKMILKYNVPEKQNCDLHDFTLLSKNIFESMQQNMNVDDFEDNVWLVADNTSKRFKIEPGKFVLYNTTERHYSAETTEFIGLVCSYLGKMNDDVKIKYYELDDSYNKVCWHVIGLSQKE